MVVQTFYFYASLSSFFDRFFSAALHFEHIPTLIARCRRRWRRRINRHFVRHGSLLPGNVALSSRGYLSYHSSSAAVFPVVDWLVWITSIHGLLKILNH